MISAVIITLNEAQHIGRCLQSLQGVVSEVIVVDSLSQDETEAICRQYGVRFISQEWKGYAFAKNLGNSLATQPYILSIDADEALSEDLRNAISELDLQPSSAYSFARLNFYCGQPIRYCGWYPDIKVRLFPRMKAAWTGDYVHESLQLDSDLTVHHLAGDLLHYTCDSIAQHLAQINRYSTLAAADMYDRGKKSTLFRLIFSAPVRFFQLYFLKLGLLEGHYGYVICKLSALSVFLRYAKLRDLEKKSVQA